MSFAFATVLVDSNIDITVVGSGEVVIFMQSSLLLYA
jgi:hypothetical protein